MANETHGMSLESLSVELIHNIYFLLDAPVVKSLRLSCKFLAFIGIDYLVRELHLLFTTDSFRRLEGISYHPTLRPTVKSIVYECGRLDHYPERRHWESHLVNPEWLEKRPRLPKNLVEANALIDYESAMKSWYSTLPNTYTQDQILSGWVEYERLQEDQEDIIRQNTDIKILSQAMGRLPYLSSVSVLNWYDRPILSHSPQMKKCYDSGLILPNGGAERAEPLGLRQMISILDAVILAKATPDSQLTEPPQEPTLRCYGGIRCKLRVLRIVDVSWCILEDYDSTNFKKCVACVRYLKELWLDLRPEDGAPWRDRRRERALTQVIRAARLLEELRLGTSMHFIDGPSLLGQGQWPSLKRFELNQVRVDEGSLLHFLNNHAGSLRIIKLHDVCFDHRIPWTEEPTSWTSFLLELKEVTAWHRCSVTGHLMVSHYGPPGENYGHVSQAIVGLEIQRHPAIRFVSQHTMDEYLMGRSDFNPLS